MMQTADFLAKNRSSGAQNVVVDVLALRRKVATLA
jgi:hypothetical protein